MRLDRVLSLLLVAACLFAALGAWSHGPRRPVAVADVSRLTPGTPQVAVLDVAGVISDGTGSSPWSREGASAAGLLSAIKEIRHDGVKVVLLRINSPGGTAAASQAVYEALVKLRKETGAKVVVSMGDLAASGAYYISCAADRVVANPATMTGSIGVIVHGENFSKLLGHWGVTDMTVKSGPHKDLFSPTKAEDPGDRQILQALVNDTYGQFLDAVATGRHLATDSVRPLADGRVFTGRQALALHLVDQLGNYDDALALAGQLAGAKGEPSTRDYGGEEPWREFVPHLGSQLTSPLGGALGGGPLGRLLVQEPHLDRVPLALME